MSDLTFPDHPILRSPTPQEIVALSKTPEGKQALINWHKQYNEKLELASTDPLNHGFRFPSWTYTLEQLQKWMEVFAFGGNGAAKSALGAWASVQCLIHNPGHRMYCFAQDDQASTQIQQRYIYDYLPPKFKKKNMSETGYLKYGMKNGFTDNSFILDMDDGTAPRECYFFKYSQYQANKAKFEGYEYGSRDPQPFTIPAQKLMLAGQEWEMPEMRLSLNIGAWLDEYLEDGELYKTLLYRIPRRGSSMFTTFTPINHMTPFVADKIKGSEVTKTIPTNTEVFYRKDDPSEVEWIREKRNSDKPKAGVGMVFMPSEHNPWAGFNNMIVLHSHKPLDEKLVRFHGIPSQQIRSLFPKFNTNVHVTDKRWKFDKKKHTAYMVADPAGRRSYSCLWAVVDGEGYIQIMSEFPERNIYGEWAKFGTPRWAHGPGSKKVYMSVKDYVQEWKKIEKELSIDVEVRIGDKRAFASENDDSLDRFSQFADEGMYFEPSGGSGQGNKGEEEVGLSMLDDWFNYDQNQPVDAVNRPILSIHESCGNLIESILNYNAEGGKDEALKDFIDLLRYLRFANAGEGPQHYDNKSLGVIKATKGGY